MIAVADLLETATTRTTARTTVLTRAYPAVGSEGVANTYAMANRLLTSAFIEATTTRNTAGLENHHLFRMRPAVVFSRRFTCPGLGYQATSAVQMKHASSTGWPATGRGPGEPSLSSVPLGPDVQQAVEVTGARHDPELTRRDAFTAV